MKIIFLDVGQGDCTFVVPPANEGLPVLFDCADAYGAERFVANHGITDLGAVVASHLDWDHIKGILPFLRQHFAAGRRVERLVVSADRQTRDGKNVGLREFVDAALKWEERPPHEGFALLPTTRTLFGPTRLAAGSDWAIDLVLPFVGTANLAVAKGIANAASAVLRVERAGRTVLVGGDAPLVSWERLEPATADVIRVPHHGGEIREHAERWKEFQELYDAVAAADAVVSVGTNNGYEHPSTEHLMAARRGGACRVLCTQLTPRCDPNPIALRDDALNSASGVEYPYRHRNVAGHPRSGQIPKEVPCAGTVIVELTPDGRLIVEPAPNGAHDSLVTRVAMPLCRDNPRIAALT